MPTAEEVEDNLSQRRMVKSEESRSLGVWWNSRKRKKARAARGADPSTGHTKINAMNHVISVKDDAMGSVKFVEVNVMGSVKSVKIVVTGFVQSSQRQTCKRLEKTDEMTNANRSNNFDALNLTESGLEVEAVNAVYVVQEIAEITVDSGAAWSVCPIRKKGVTRTKASKTERLAAASVLKEMRDCNLFGTARSAT